MGKTMKGKEKAKAKVAKAKAKVARKCKGGKCALTAVALLASLIAAGCLGTQTPSRSQSLTLRDCTVNVYGSGTETNDVARVELATQAMSIENSGTENQTATPTLDIRTRIDARYNDALAAANAASRSVLGSIGDGITGVLDLMASKGSGTVKVTKADGTPATVECADGQCSFCEEAACSP